MRQRIPFLPLCLAIVALCMACAGASCAVDKGTLSSTDVLIGELHSQSWEIRKAAAEQLGRMGAAAKHAVPALAKALEDRNQDVIIAALNALGEIGPDAAPATFSIISAMKSSYIPTIVAGEKTLKRIDAKGGDILRTRLLQNLEEMLKGSRIEEADLSRLLHVMSLYPCERYVPALLRAARHEWPIPPERQHGYAIPEYTWRNLANYEDKLIADLAMQQAANPELRVHPATDIFRALRRNSAHLTRQGVLTVLASPKLKDLAFTGSNNLGWQATLVLAEVAEEEDVPRLIEMLAAYWPHRSSDDRGRIRECLLKHPDVAKPALRKTLALGQKPGDFKPWAHEFSIGLVPGALLYIASLLVELKDTMAIPLFEFFGTNDLVRVGDTMKWLAPEYLAALDCPSAMRALRNITPNGMVQRVKLGDPIAIDWALAEAERIQRPDANGICWDDTGESERLFGLVRALGCPKEVDVAKWWHENRPIFVIRFTEKYGFAPEK
jgi:hypothetical protein